MSDVVVRIVGLEVPGRHGVHDEERILGQRFVLDLEMTLANDRATTSDDLADTVDYAALSDAVVAIVRGKPVALLERLARVVADRVLEEPAVRAVNVTIAKPHVAIPHVLDEVSVTLYAEADGS